MGRRTKLALAVMTFAWFAGCSEPNPFVGSAPRTIEAFVPEGAPVHDEFVAEFTTDDGPARFTYVAYGRLSDCASGCFSSHVCAIEDDAGVQLWSASWHPVHVDEIPVGLVEQCPGIRVDDAGVPLASPCEPLGKSHPLTSNAEFRRFVERDPFSGPFRRCFTEYAAFGCLWSPCP